MLIHCNLICGFTRESYDSPQILKKFYSCTIWGILKSQTGSLLGTVWQLLGTTENRAYGPVNHWDRAPCHPGPLYMVVLAGGPKNGQTPATQAIDCYLCYHMASGTSAPSLEPTGP